MELPDGKDVKSMGEDSVSENPSSSSHARHTELGNTNATKRYYLYDKELKLPSITYLASVPVPSRSYARPRLPYHQHDYAGIYPTADEEKFQREYLEKRYVESQIYSRPRDINHERRPDRREAYWMYEKDWENGEYFMRKRYSRDYSRSSNTSCREDPRRYSDGALSDGGYERYGGYDNVRDAKKYKLMSRRRQSNELNIKEAKGCPKDYDLKAEIYPLMHFIENKEKLLSEAMGILRGKKLNAMTPPCFAGLNHMELQILCQEELNTVNIATIANVIDGKVVNSDTQIVSKKKKRKKRKEEVTEGPILKKTKREKKEHKKKRKKKREKNEDREEGASPGLPPQKTLMELLELEYRAKAIKALLKSQDFNSSQIDDVFASEPSDPKANLTADVSIQPSRSIEGGGRCSATIFMNQISTPDHSRYVDVCLSSPTAVGEGDSFLLKQTNIISSSLSNMRTTRSLSPSEGSLQKFDPFLETTASVVEATDSEVEDEYSMYASMTNSSKKFTNELTREDLDNIGRLENSTEATNSMSPISRHTLIKRIECKVKPVQEPKEEDTSSEEGEIGSRDEGGESDESEIIPNIPDDSPPPSPPPDFHSPLTQRSEISADDVSSDEELLLFEPGSDDILYPLQIDPPVNSVSPQLKEEEDVQCDNVYSRHISDSPLQNDVAGDDLSPGVTAKRSRGLTFPFHDDVSSDDSEECERVDDGIIIGGDNGDNNESEDELLPHPIYGCEPRPDGYEENNMTTGIDEEDEDTNPRTWFHRWYTSKKVQKNVRRSKVIGKLRAKLRREKVIVQNPDPEPEPTEEQVPIIGSISEYHKLFPSTLKFKKAVDNPEEEGSGGKQEGSENGNDVDIESTEEDDEALWGDIMG